MTKATTAVDRRATCVAWATAAVLHVGAFGLLWQMDRPTGAALRVGEQSPARHQVERRDQVRRQQRSQILPGEHARLLMEQSELLVRRELRQRLERFNDMAETVLHREEQLLAQIERRPTTSAYRDEVNNTAPARINNEFDMTRPGPDASIQWLHDRLAELEGQIQLNYTDSRAAELALRRGQSFPDVRSLLQPSTSRMPSFQDLVRDEGSGPLSAARLEIRTIDDLNTYRQVLQRSSRESALAEARLASLVRRVDGPSEGSGQGDGSGQAGGYAMGMGQGSGQGYGASFHGSLSSEASEDEYLRSLDPEMVQAQALPGRRFSRDSNRRGWLYINTWYMIGPWYNFGRNDFAIVHPPELGIDFDAVYADGQRGVGIAERESHPIEVRGQEVRLDGMLGWKFMQSESIHNVPPVTIDWSTYYAYTELYFDEPAIMYVAVGTDDSGKVWINGEEIWQDRGMSWYKIDEHVQPFRFNQGVNRVLVRLENDGGGATGFSFLVCPPDAISLSEKR